MLNFVFKLIEDYYESIGNELLLEQDDHRLHDVLVWIVTGNLPEHNEKHCGPPAA